MISVSFDIDWAPDFVLEDTLNLLRNYGVSATFFATHASTLLNSEFPAEHELGIHPNFNPNFEGNGSHYTEVIDQLLHYFPESIGVRFHSLGYNAHVLKYCADNGIKYDSSVYLPTQVKPYKDYANIIRVPFQLSDLQMVIDNRFDLDFQPYINSLPFSFALHPIHLFLNTCSFAHYNDAKPYLKDPKLLPKFINSYDKPGVRNTFINLLKTPNTQFSTMSEIYNHAISS